ncbi:sigma-70 family RNA polymerase sigma factor [Actinokineospora bangkokensis]|uniref:RNA polymerase subunit sigma n=1 Tax=Actinokineospora bangkokensis TaxID=1193682 RepID=A0A1Q9LU54_9PSEU|nr:sigma-70 family RNA polymerase sigma factor [Actinokineospora bangkokensis]OLR95577.1 hypothetical protein BJP25_00345 [Actinokineospora bangkokensis]
MTWDDRPAQASASEGAGADAHADRDLLHRLRAGDDAAFGELFSRHSDAVRRLALGVSGDRAEADDLTAEAFFRVLQAIRRGAGPVDNARGYLLIVVRRVAWEWAGRRRELPVSDEELDHRVGAAHDDGARSTERTLITRAFTSLPERWRTVLWKVEVEGERPAVVAGKFGLSPNATAALARRARQGLRAAYLQAHLTTERGSTGCRSVLEKLGAYTAGSITGSERSRVRTHLQACSSCATTQAELADVCSGLRAHAAHLAVPVLGLAAAHTAHALGWGAGAKAVLASAKFQVVAAAASAAAVGALTLLPLGTAGEQQQAYADLDGSGATLEVGPPTTSTTTTGAAGPTSVPPTAASSAIVPGPTHRPTGAHPVGKPAAPPAAPATTSAAVGTGSTAAQPRTESATALESPQVYDRSLPVVSRQVSYERKWAVYDRYDVVSETSTTTLVNAAAQTTVATSSTEYTQYREPGRDPAPTTREQGGPTGPTVTRTPSG